MNKLFKQLRKYILTTLLFLSMLLPTFSVQASSEITSEKTNSIKVGWYQSTSFQEGVGDEEKSGYSYEYLEKIADYTDWEYEYVDGDWASLFEMLENKEIDILAGVSKTEEREKTMLFSSYAMGYDRYYLYQHDYDQSMNIDDLNSFEGKKIGAIKNIRMTTFLEKWAEENKIELNIIYYDSFRDRDADFANGKLDGITATDNIILSNMGYSPVVKLGEEPYYLAVNKNRSDILRTLNKVLGALNEIDPYLIQNLQYSYYGHTISNTTLSDEESAWLANHPVIRVGFMEDYLPFCGYDKDGNVTGVIATIIPMIFGNLEITDDISIEYYSYDTFAQVGEAISKGEVDISFPAISERKYLNKMNITGSSDLIAVPFYIAYTGTYSNETFSKIAINTRPLDSILNAYPESEIIKTEDAYQSLDAVLSGEATCTFMASYRLKQITNNPKYRAIKTMPFSESISYCIGVSKESKELLSIVNKGISLLDKAVVPDLIFKSLQDSTTYSAEDFVKDNLLEILAIGLLVFILIISGFALYVRNVKKSKKRIEEQLSENRILNSQLLDALEQVNALAALSEDYEAVHLADLDDETFTSFRLSKGLEKRNYETTPLPYTATVESIIKTFVAPDEQERFLRFVSVENLKNKMTKDRQFTYRYAVIPDTTGHNYYEMTFVKAGDDPDRHLLIVGTKCIDNLLKIEREEGQFNAALLHNCAYFYEFDVTEGNISGEITSTIGYNPFFDLSIEFPINYDEYNNLRKDKLGMITESEREDKYWTCQGLLEEYEKGKRVLDLHYSSESLRMAWSATIVLTKDDTSNHLHAFYICKDVTEDVETERRQKRELEKALQEARRANAAKSDFLSRMSHDIRTPLNGIIGLIEISEKHQDDLELVKANRKKEKIAANHLLSLINDVLDMSKLEDGNMELANEPFNLIDIANEVLTICGVRANDNGITLRHDDGASIVYPDVFGSPLHLKQIMMNLINNGIKYNKPNGRITCNTYLENYDFDTATYTFEVSDTGIGISPEYIEHIYEPFTQEKNDARSRYQGTGIGMAIVKALVDKMGGKITIRSEVGVGTTFLVTIPFRVNHAADNQGKDLTGENTEKSIDGMRFLLVEDNELNMEIAQTILEDAGAIITTAENGQEAYDIYFENKPGSFDVILMDIMMPVLDGYKATEKIRNSEKADSQTIPIIAMTANAFAEDVMKAKNAGMNDHISKPLQMEKLILTLAKYR